MFLDPEAPQEFYPTSRPAPTDGRHRRSNECSRRWNSAYMTGIHGREVVSFYSIKTHLWL